MRVSPTSWLILAALEVAARVCPLYPLLRALRVTAYSALRVVIESLFAV